ncbi:MAG: BrnT family toxin [Oscillospiraceae bacterium]|nr:BrnT family toxin [Oscillospiraceae bacterium]
MQTESYVLYDNLFNWDKEKNLSNIEKHGVPFKEAVTVFLDPNAILLDDEEHSLEEERFNIIGVSQNLRLLTVCHCYRDENAVIRIISARKATKLEKKLYGDGM